MGYLTTRNKRQHSMLSAQQFSERTTGLFLLYSYDPSVREDKYLFLQASAKGRLCEADLGNLHSLGSENIREKRDFS